MKYNHQQKLHSDFLGGKIKVLRTRYSESVDADLVLEGIVRKWGSRWPDRLGFYIML